MRARCPTCDSWVYVDEDEVELGDQVECSDCGELLRVTSLDPLELDYELGEEEEDED